MSMVEDISINIYANWLGSNTLQQISTEMGEIGELSKQTAVDVKGLATEMTMLGGTAISIGKLGEMFGFLSESEADAVMQLGAFVTLSASVIRAFDTIASSSWAVTIAEWARAKAHAIAHAMAGPAGWAILAVAATTAAVAIATVAAHTREATSAQNEFTRAVHDTESEMATYTRSIVRAGEIGLWNYLRSLEARILAQQRALIPVTAYGREEEPTLALKERVVELERYRRGVEEP